MKLSDAEYFVEVFNNRKQVVDFITKVNGKDRIIDIETTGKLMVSVPECLQRELMRITLKLAEESVSHYDSIISKYERTND